MSSPLGHSVIGLAFGFAWFIPPRQSWREWVTSLRAHWRALAGCVLLSNAPDIDYLFGIPAGNLNAYHQYYTHTLGWVFVLVLGIWLLWIKRHPASHVTRFIFLMALAGSHLIIDLLSGDTGWPFGIMALWPFFSERIYWPDYAIFMDLNKSTGYDLATWHNVMALLQEAAITVPVLGLVLLSKSPRLPFFCRRRKNDGVG